MTMTNHNTMRIGADVGGTFTDVVLIDANGNIWTHKVPSTPPDFERAVLNAIEHLLRTTNATPLRRGERQGIPSPPPLSGGAGATVSEVAHGTTVATNAVLEKTRRENRADHYQRLPRCSRTEAHPCTPDVRPVL